MRIIYARSLYLPRDFGGNRYPFEVTRRLASRGHEVTVVTGRIGGAQPQAVPNLRLIQYPCSTANPLATFVTHALSSRAAIGSAEHAANPDVLVLSSYEVAYAQLLRRRRPPTVFIYHSAFHSVAIERLRRAQWPASMAGSLAGTFARHVQRTVLRSADLIIAVSPFSAREIQDSTGGRSAPVRVIPTGVDVDLFSPGDRDTARRSLGIADAGHVLVTVGRLTAVKRYDRAIRVVAALRSTGLDVSLLIVGRGEEEPTLRKLGDELGISGAVRFEGFRDGAELVQRLRAADVQLCTSEFENWSLALLEGLATGLPVVGTPYGGIPELLRPVSANLVAATAEIDDLTRAVRPLLIDPALAADVRRRARDYATEFGWDSVVSALERSFAEVVARNTRPATFPSERSRG